MILLDTNILVCSSQPAHPEYQNVTQKLLQLVALGNELVICPQTMYELYVVATRPTASRGGLGMNNTDALQLLDNLQQIHSFMNDPDTLFVSWKQLMNSFATMGKTAHDARLVAFMTAHGINELYTQNVTDFNRYSSIISIV